MSAADGAQKGPQMAATQPDESRATARRRLTDEMLRLGERIDRLESGPERLQLLRQQAKLSDELEALRAIRH
jgi:hypothetical protein